MKYGVNRVTLVGNVGEAPRVSERDGEAFVPNFPLATNEFYKSKEGEAVSKTEWHHSVVDVVTPLFKNNTKTYVELSPLKLRILKQNQNENLYANG